MARKKAHFKEATEQSTRNQRNTNIFIGFSSPSPRPNDPHDDATQAGSSPEQGGVINVIKCCEVVRPLRQR